MSKAKSKYIRVSPNKLRPFADVVRGDTVEKAISWLKTCAVKRATPMIKTIFSAYSNAKNMETGGAEVSMKDYVIKQICVDVGPVIKYYKPGAMGRAAIQRKRLSHLCVVVEKQS
jgi:large subunit ribosomal protein L22